MGINKFSDLTTDQMPLNQHKLQYTKWQPPVVPDRPHAVNNTNVRVDCECENDMAIEGFDVNNYTWLDSQKKCLMVDWVREGKVGYPRD